ISSTSYSNVKNCSPCSTASPFLPASYKVFISPPAQKPFSPAPCKITTLIVESRSHVNKLSFSFTNMSYVRSEEHTSELQSRFDLVCRLLLDKKQYHHC